MVKTVINAKDTLKFFDELVEELEYIYFLTLSILILSFRVLIDRLLYELMTTTTYLMQVFQECQRRI